MSTPLPRDGLLGAGSENDFTLLEHGRVVKAF
jgi:hypothetical protein